MTDNAIEAVGLSKRFVVHTERRRSLKEVVARGRAPQRKFFWALHDATFSVPKGSSLGIIGHNGSGKSTALKVLTGIYRPTSGHVAVNGSVAALLEVGAGFHPELTGRENVRLNATILGFTGREIDRMMDQIIEFADIGDHIDAPIKHYSSGMYVRLGFAVAVMVRPDILLIDEVIAVGDEEFQRRCYDFLYDLRRSGTSMIIVSHGMGQITELCDQALWLAHGDIQLLGPSPSVVAAYLTSVNLAESERGVAQAASGPEFRAGDASAVDEDPPRVGELAGSRGSGLIRVTDIELLDGHGTPTTVLFTGSPATLRLHHRCEADLDLVEVGLTFEDGNGTVACAVFTQPEEWLTVPEGRGVIDFAVDSFLLAPGRYELNSTLRRHGHLLDAVDEGLPVTVRDPGIKISGSYLQPGTWRTASGPAVGQLTATAAPSVGPEPVGNPHPPRRDGRSAPD